MIEFVLEGGFMLQKFFSHILTWVSLFPALLALACSGGVGVGGAGGAGVGANPQNFASVGGANPADGSNNDIGDSLNLNQPPVAGGEGHGEEAPKRFLITVGFKGGPSNCGNFSDNLPDIFPQEEDEAPKLRASFSNVEAGPFYNPETGAVNSKGRRTFSWAKGRSCPDFIRPQTEQVILQLMRVAFSRVEATYADSTGKFYQSESKVLDCSVESCTVRPCEICLNLVEVSSLDIADEETVVPPNTRIIDRPVFTIPDSDSSSLQPFQGLPLLNNLNENGLRTFPLQPRK
jgi:hypothetical protein